MKFFLLWIVFFSVINDQNEEKFRLNFNKIGCDHFCVRQQTSFVRDDGCKWNFNNFRIAFFSHFFYFWFVETTTEMNGQRTEILRELPIINSIFFEYQTALFLIETDTPLTFQNERFSIYFSVFLYENFALNFMWFFLLKFHIILSFKFYSLKKKKLLSPHWTFGSCLFSCKIIIIYTHYACWFRNMRTDFKKTHLWNAFVRISFFCICKQQDLFMFIWGGIIYCVGAPSSTFSSQEYI